MRMTLMVQGRADFGNDRPPARASLAHLYIHYTQIYIVLYLLRVSFFFIYTWLAFFIIIWYECGVSTGSLEG